MEYWHLQEHAKQLGDIISAQIEMEAMKAKNKERELKGESLAYSEADFIQLLEDYELGHNGIVTKSIRFQP